MYTQYLVIDRVLQLSVLVKASAETPDIPDICPQEFRMPPPVSEDDTESGAVGGRINHGQRLTPSQLGRLAGCGVATLQVHQKPRIGLLISGDELVPAGLERRAGAIWESNGTLLEAILNSLHQVVHSRCVVPDQPEALRR